MRTNNPSFINPAMDVIKGTEPVTYARMQHARWTVHVVSDMSDDSELERFGFGDIMNFMIADGVTFSKHAADWECTLINKDQAEKDAAWLHSTVPHYLATVLVHEFQHHLGKDEVPAFNAGTRLAVELGDNEVARKSAEICEHARKGDYPS